MRPRARRRTGRSTEVNDAPAISPIHRREGKPSLTTGLGRLARLEDIEGGAEMLATIPDDSPLFETGPRATLPNAGFGNRKDDLMAGIPADAEMPARGIARTYTALLGGRRRARLVKEAARNLCPGILRGGPDHGKPVHAGAGQ